jgi:hypothetical protein
MNINDFSNKVYSQTQRGCRYGQAVWNVLMEKDTRFTTSFVGGDYDCFYNDDVAKDLIDRAVEYGILTYN